MSILAAVVFIYRLARNCETSCLYGNTFTVQELQRRAIAVIEPENIKTVLSLNFKDYGIRYCLELFRPLLGEGIFNTDGDHLGRVACADPADLRLLEGLLQDLMVLLLRDGTTADL
ncbi:LOW QUALITY PROTEIN: uncharacterized protein ACLA_051510 [Aspergillus clavatus NRRL 1]|uniref:Uncharacterized protein n=1 Tax=Aspergillus clavatus (strain ATCC 1007 / CBS 513.65 / DSM 816 / NCTC 3887 / NRRL 1 / QM 1276 / 107) TaxID=344612 RepID=A1CIH4_ASPCL|nr:LOW QUALITY PROTEIN: uncharacterized protein ACLA_051510 [Aspergillus clavatus NRRL 1]EAW10679.1 hypothetical protein ACLA_051510 [Aspergillus clavatus NRRL 1]